MGGQGFRVFAAIRYDDLAGPRFWTRQSTIGCLEPHRDPVRSWGKKQLGRAGKALGDWEGGATPLTVYIHIYIYT